MDFLPKYKLSKEQCLWLKTIWNYLLKNGHLPKYNSIRRETLNKTGADFNPHDIPKDLIKEHATEITLLGVFHIDSSKKITQDANRILNYIRLKLIDDDEKTDYTLTELAKEISADEIYTRIVFKLISDYGSFWNSAGQKSDDSQYGYERFSITDPDIFDNYMRFESFEKELEKHFQKIEEWSKQEDTFNRKRLSIGASIKHRGPAIQNSESFVDTSRIEHLKSIEQKSYDLSKLIKLCEELNTNHSFNNYYSIALLTRALIDHIPPIFGFNAFGEFANNYKSEKNERSFKKTMLHLNNSLRNIGDSSLHSQIRKSESLPNETQIDFKNDLDVLLGEIERVLRIT